MLQSCLEVKSIDKNNLKVWIQKFNKDKKYYYRLWNDPKIYQIIFNINFQIKLDEALILEN